MAKRQVTTDRQTTLPLPKRRPSRAVIQPVAPIVDGGRFGAKASLGEPVEVLADVFTDGHDHVAAAVRYRRVGDDSWSEVPMVALGNDRHRALFEPDRIGVWEFDITAWVDHFDTQRDGIVAKAAAGMDITVELATLAVTLGAMRAKATAADRAAIDGLLRVCDEGRYDPVLASPDLAALSWRTHPRTPKLTLPEPLDASWRVGHYPRRCLVGDVACRSPSGLDPTSQSKRL
jgi:starch synthase (maltosyl-transferring)